MAEDTCDANRSKDTENWKNDPSIVVSHKYILEK
jgi:hypothetical protein